MYGPIFFCPVTHLFQIILKGTCLTLHLYSVNVFCYKILYEKSNKLQNIQIFFGNIFISCVSESNRGNEPPPRTLTA